MTEESNIHPELLELPPEMLKLHELLSRFQQENLLLRRQLASSTALLDIAVSKLASLGFTFETPVDLQQLRTEARRSAPSSLPPTTTTTTPPGGSVSLPLPFMMPGMTREGCTVSSSSSSSSSSEIHSLRGSTSASGGMSAMVGNAASSAHYTVERSGGDGQPNDPLHGHPLRSPDGGTSGGGSGGDGTAGGGGGGGGLLPVLLPPGPKLTVSTKTIGSGGSVTIPPSSASPIRGSGSGTEGENVVGTTTTVTPTPIASAGSPATTTVPNAMVRSAASGPIASQKRKRFTLTYALSHAHTKWIHCCAFATGETSPVLATAGMDGQLVVHRPLTEGGGEERGGGGGGSTPAPKPFWCIPSAHRECVNDLSWLSPTTVATASLDGTVRVWDIERAVVGPIEGRDGVERSERTVRDDHGGGVREEEEEAKLYEYASEGLMLACCALQKPYVFACSNSLRQVALIDTRAPRPVTVIREWNSRVNTIAYDPTCQELFMGHSNGGITGWDVRHLPSQGERSRSGSSRSGSSSSSSGGGSAPSTALPLTRNHPLPRTTSSSSFAQRRPTGGGAGASLSSTLSEDGGDTLMMSSSGSVHAGATGASPSPALPSVFPPSSSSFLAPPSSSFSSAGVAGKGASPPPSALPSFPTAVGPPNASRSSFSNASFSSSSVVLPRAYQFQQVWSTTDSIPYSAVEYVSHVMGEDHSKRLVSVTNGNVVRLYGHAVSLRHSTTATGGGGGGGTMGGPAASAGTWHARPPAATNGMGDPMTPSSRPAYGGEGGEGYVLHTTFPSPPSALLDEEEEEDLASAGPQDRAWTASTERGGGGGECDGMMRAAFWKGAPSSRSTLLPVEEEEAHDHASTVEETDGEEEAEEEDEEEDDGKDGYAATGEGSVGALSRQRRGGGARETQKARRTRGEKGSRRPYGAYARSGEDEERSRGTGPPPSWHRPITERDLLITGSVRGWSTTGVAQYRAIVYDASEAGRPVVLDTLDGHRDLVAGAAVHRVRESLLVATVSRDSVVRMWTSTNG